MESVLSQSSRRPDASPDYGPRGYLPERAAKRARKIVMREPMGLHWPVAAVVAALVLAAVGAVYVVTRTGPPGPPFVEAGALEAVDPRGAGLVVLPSGRDVLVVRGGGGVSVFAGPGEDVLWCRASRRLESPSGRVWRLDGRLVGGPGASLQPLRSQVFDGVLYVSPGADVAAPDPRPAGEQPVCAN